MNDPKLDQPTDPPFDVSASSGFVVTVRDENGKRSLGLTVVLDSGAAGSTAVTVNMSPEKSAKLRASLEKGEVRCRSGLEVVTNGHVPTIPFDKGRRDAGR